MYEDLIPQYDSLVAEYKKIVSDGFCKAEFKYNEIEFYAHRFILCSLTVHRPFAERLVNSH